MTDQAVGTSDKAMMRVSGESTMLHRTSSNTDMRTGAHMTMLRLFRLICLCQQPRCQHGGNRRRSEARLRSTSGHIKCIKGTSSLYSQMPRRVRIICVSSASAVRPIVCICNCVAVAAGGEVGSGAYTRRSSRPPHGSSSEGCDALVKSSCRLKPHLHPSSPPSASKKADPTSESVKPSGSYEEYPDPSATTLEEHPEPCESRSCCSDSG